ncbi:MAG: PHP domain-containing protein [Chloroflexota bacterium]|nr:PHP domain-containing protein [Chloroflexota bacterium]
MVAQIKARGIDGIGVTEHWDREYGFQVKEIVERCFASEVLIIPGREIDIAERQEVELYLPDGSIFRFLAHPGFPAGSYVVENVQGIEIDNYLHDWHIDKPRVTALAEEHGLLLLRSSDAHSIERIGCYYTEVSLEELSARATSAV